MLKQVSKQNFNTPTPKASTSLQAAIAQRRIKLTKNDVDSNDESENDWTDEDD